MAQNTQSELHGLSERRQRIFAYCDIASMQLGFSVGERFTIREAVATATAGTASKLLPTPRLLIDLGLPEPSGEDQPLDPGPLSTRISDLIDAACELDDELEFAPYAQERLARLLSEPVSSPSESIRTIVPLLRKFDASRVRRLAPKLPVFPIVMVELLRAYRDDSASAAAIAKIAARDQILAGSIIAAARSAQYPLAREIQNIREAVAYIGMTRAFEVMLEAALKPLLFTPGIAGLWDHSLEAAEIAVRLAHITNVCPTEEAFLLGLVHDIGRLLIELTPTDVRSSRDRLAAGGCPLLIAEVLTCGLSHAEAGAEVLRYWNFPETFVEAVRDHHEPDHSHSRRAALLYVMEFWSDSEEDLPSHLRLEAALEQLSVTRDDLVEAMAKRA